MQIKRRYTDRTGKELEFICGYDDDLKYVFMSVWEENKLIYDNLNLTNALEIKDFSYFKNVARKNFGVSLDDIEIEINYYIESIALIDKPTTNVYNYLLIIIENTEKKCNTYKQKMEDLFIKKHYKQELHCLHEVRRIIEKFDNFKIN
ncbi:MAG: hypothetical protein AB7S49_03960 [Arcobacter sp.]|uniref:hypothetical protein n=1 Tax=Arcobacter sp. TaxID=1872629 RepID=UPI003D082EEE